MTHAAWIIFRDRSFWQRGNKLDTVWTILKLHVCIIDTRTPLSLNCILLWNVSGWHWPFGRITWTFFLKFVSRLLIFGRDFNLNNLDGLTFIALDVGDKKISGDNLKWRQKRCFSSHTSNKPNVTYVTLPSWSISYKLYRINYMSQYERKNNSEILKFNLSCV